MRALSVKPVCCASGCGGRKRTYVRHECHSELPKPVAERVELLKKDVEELYESRLASFVSVDAAFRDVFKKELELHKKVADKWLAIAKSDVERLKDKKSARWSQGESVEADIEVEADAEVSAPPPAAEAYYEPWVKDD